MTIQELIDYHQKQASHFEQFGAENALTAFHLSAVGTLKTAIAKEREACAVVAQGWGGVYSGCGRVCDDIAKEIRMRSNA